MGALRVAVGPNRPAGICKALEVEVCMGGLEEGGKNQTVKLKVDSGVFFILSNYLGNFLLYTSDFLPFLVNTHTRIRSLGFPCRMTPGIRNMSVTRRTTAKSLSGWEGK